MADLQQLLRMLGIQGESQGELNLNPGAPVNRPETRGIFGRRPMGRAFTGMDDIAPMAPAWAEPSPFRDIQPEAQPALYAMGPGAFMGGDEIINPAPMPQAARVRPVSPDSPAAYSSFADYAGLLSPDAPADREPWRQPVSTATWAQGMPSIGRGMEPPSAPAGRSQASLEDEAWDAAMQRVRRSIKAVRRHRNRSIPRPGMPMIAQAWAEPDPGGLIGGLVGSRGRPDPNRAPRRDRR